MSKKNCVPIILTGKVWVINALADLYPCRELRSTREIKAGDFKLWCQRSPSSNAPAAAGQFRAAVYDGKSWRTFRLNIVSRDKSFYESFKQRDERADIVLKALISLSGRTASYRQGSYGVTFVLKEPKSESTDSFPKAARAEAAQPEKAEPQAAKSAAPGGGKLGVCADSQPEHHAAARHPATARKRRKKRDDSHQLRLF